MTNSTGGPPAASACRGLAAMITRPRSEAVALAAALAERRIDTLIEPMLDVAYYDMPAPDLAGVQALLYTSANGVRAFARISRERHLPVFAVGDATAARARAEGFLRVKSAGGNLGDLVRLTAERLRADAGRLLHVSGSTVAGDLAGELSRRGFAVERIALYDARPATALSAEAAAALRAGRIGFALFFSPRTAQVFVRLIAEADLAAALRRVFAMSISAAADAALSPLPFRRRLIAERPDQGSLLDAMDGLLATRCPA